MDDYLEVHRLTCDERAPAHAASAGYGVDRFVADPAHLSAVVRFDPPLLGDVSGLTGIHLPCHIGTDTLSLARLGARMTGLDLPPPTCRSMSSSWNPSERRIAKHSSRRPPSVVIAAPARTGRPARAAI